MSADRYVLVVVGRARERWLTELGRWSTTGAAPLEVLRCLGGEEALAVLGSGRRVSALMVDARAAVDRDLVATAGAHDVPTLVVSDGSVHRDWEALGCVAVLDAGFDRDRLLSALAEHCTTVDRTRRPARVTLARREPTACTFVGVLGTGGSGTSTVAMGLAQAVGADSSTGTDGAGRVVLVDGARRGELAMYHDVGDVIPGLPELVEAHRGDRLDPLSARELTYRIDERGYDLLLGRRRPNDWVVLRRRAVAAALDTLARSYRAVIVDMDADLDGEHDTGSADVGDRHSVAISVLERADVVLVVGRPGLKGLHSLATLLGDVVDAGVPPTRVQPVINGIGRNPAVRAAASRTLHRLCSTETDDLAVSALHLRTVRTLEEVHRRRSALPRVLCEPLGRAVDHLLHTLPRRGADDDATLGDRIRPGELGTRLDRHGTGPLGPLDRSDVA